MSIRKKRSVKVVVDGTSDLDQKVIDEYGITIQDLTVSFGNTSIPQSDLTPDEFYEMLEKNPTATTAAPNSSKFMDTFQGLFQGGYNILVLTTIKEKSATYENAEMSINALARDKKDKIRLIDSRTTSAGLGLIAMRSALYARDHTLEETAAYAESLISRQRIYATITDFTYAIKGGRAPRIIQSLGGIVSSAPGRFAQSVIKVRPLITIKEGEPILMGKIVTDKVLGKKIKELMITDINHFQNEGGLGEVDLFYMHANNPETMEKIKPITLEALAQSDVKPGIYHEGRIGPIVGTHGGPTTAGLAILYHPPFNK